MMKEILCVSDNDKWNTQDFPCTPYMDIINDETYDGKDISEIVAKFKSKVYFVVADSDTMKNNMFIVIERSLKDDYESEDEDEYECFKIDVKHLWNPVNTIMPFDHYYEHSKDGVYVP
jgi:hypothetical protein